MSLNMGGDDITEFLNVLLEKICFPYRDIDLARSYDWKVMEDLKARLCTLAEVGTPRTTPRGEADKFALAKRLDDRVMSR